MPTSLGDTIVQLKVDRSAFTRLPVVSTSCADINLKESLGTFNTFSAVPRSMFALDGTQLLCANKSKLMKILENQVTVTGEVGVDITNNLQPLANQTPVNSSHSSVIDISNKLTVVVLDGVTEVQYKPWKKTPTVKTCSNLQINLTGKYTRSRYDETHLVFYTYRED